MADAFKTFKVTQPILGGPLQEALVGAISVSGGPADAGKVVVSDPTTGQVYASSLVQIGQPTTSAVSITNSPTHAGEVLISQPGNTTTAWADPQVQGLYAEGSSIASPPAYAPPTTIQPVLVGAANPGGNLANLNVDSGGNLLVTTGGGGSSNITEWASIPLGAPTAWGTPATGNVIGTNAELFAGTTALTATGSSLDVNVTNSGPISVTGTVSVSGTVAVTQSTSPWVVSGTVTSNIQASGTALTATGSSLNVNVTNSSGSTVTGGQTAEAVAAWTSSTTVNTALALNVVGYGTVKITLAQGTTISGGVVNFEASDTLAGTNWYEVNVSQDNAGSSIPPNSTYTLVASTLQSFTMSSSAWVQVRVRLSTPISGTATVAVGIAAMAFSGGGGGGGGSSGGGTQYTEGTTVPTATGTVAMGKNATNVVLALKLDGSGNLDSNIQSANFAAVPGAALPPTTVWVAASDGTDLQGLLVESSANKNLRVALFSGASEATLTGGSLNANITNTTLSTQDAADVTAGTTSAPTKVLVVAGKTADGTPAYDPIPLIAGGTAVSVSSVNDFSQGSTTSGQKGPLVQGAVTTAAPSYSNGQTDPLSLTTTGYLRTQLDAEANANTSTPVPTNAVFVASKGANGNLYPLSSSTNNGFIDVNASFSGTINPGFVADRQVSGTITALNGVVNASTQGASMASIRVTGTWSAVLTFQLSTEDGTFETATVYPMWTGGAGVQTTTGNGVWAIPVGGASNVQVDATTFTSGTANVFIEVGSGNMFQYVVQPTASNLNATVVVSGNVAVTQATSPWLVDGSLTNNNAAPIGNNLGVLPALVVSGAQSWTAGRQSLLTVSTGGYLLTEDLSDGLVGTGTQPTTALQVAGWDGTNLTPLSTTSNGFLNVNASISGSFTPALTSDATATGSITSTQNVAVSTQGTGTTQFRVTGTWTGTLVFEASIDGTNFYSVKTIARYPTSLPTVSQTTANGQWSLASGGLNMFRVRGNTVATGSASVWIEAGAGSQDMQTLAMIYDPSTGNTPVVVGASTTPTVSNNALVVALSPNSAITTTTVPTTAAEALVVALSPNSSQFATSTTATTLPGTNPQTIGTSSSAVVNANTSRKELTITNTGTTYIYLGLGQTPTGTSYHIALTKCTAANDGTGGTWTSDMWKGAVNAISSAVGGTVNLVELT